MRMRAFARSALGSPSVVDRWNVDGDPSERIGVNQFLGEAPVEERLGAFARGGAPAGGEGSVGVGGKPKRRNLRHGGKGRFFGSGGEWPPGGVEKADGRVGRPAAPRAL